MRRLSLRLRLALAGAVAIVAAIALASLGMAALFGAHVERRAVAELSVQLDQVIAGLERGQDGEIELTRTPADPRFSRPYAGLYWQIETPVRILRSRSLWDVDLALPEDELPDGMEHVHTLSGPVGDLLVIERSVTLPERLGGTLLRAAVGMDRTELATAKAAFLRDLAPYSALLTLALIAAGWMQIAVGLRPLAAIRDRVAAVRSGQARRLGADFPAEVLPLVNEVDALLAAREAEIETARTRAGDLAHGLKTPLQALLGEAGRLRVAGHLETAGAVEDIATAMGRHVDRELARTRVSIRGRDTTAPVADVVRGLVSVIARAQGGRRIDWVQEVPTDLVAAADPDDLAEALGALIENAARHAAGKVRLSGRRVGDRVDIAVIDDGAGIPPDRIAALMARGARADMRGTGLGLAIAGDIADALGGTLSLHPRDTGLEARLSVPAAKTEPD